MKFHLRLTLFLLILANNLAAQTLPEGPQVLTYYSTADDTEQPYGLYLPKNFSPRRKYPLVVMLHGAGSNHRLALRRVFGKSNTNGETDVEASRYFPEWDHVNYIVATPFARGTGGYQGLAEKDVYDVVADVRRRFIIDENRTYLTGLSMGGGGTLWLGLTRPDLWAAIAPVCPLPPRDTEYLVPNAFNLPAKFFHGDSDQTVPVSVSRDWVKRLREHGSHVEYDEYPGVNHNSWEHAYRDGEIFKWFDQFERNPMPDEVHFRTRRYQYNRAYWVTLDRLADSVSAIDAKFTSANALEITTSNVHAFTLEIGDHPKFNVHRPLQLSVNGTTIAVQSARIISLTARDGRWMQEKYLPGENEKQKGKEGPIGVAFSDRHVYVYGTLGVSSEQEQKLRHDIALKAANWSVYRNAFLGRFMFFPRVIADTDVRPGDLESSNLILFGTRETNAIIQKYGSQLPFHLDQRAVETHGLMYVYPVGGRYFVVNSGLPWWTSASWNSFPLPGPQGLLSDLPDFILFTESIQVPLVQGSFNENWNLPKNQREKLLKTGVIGTK